MNYFVTAILTACMSRHNQSLYITYPSQWRCKTVASHSCIIVCTDIANSLNKMTTLRTRTLFPLWRRKKTVTTVTVSISNIHLRSCGRLDSPRCWYWIGQKKNTKSDVKCTVAQHLSNEKRMWYIVHIYSPPSLCLWQVCLAPPPSEWGGWDRLLCWQADKGRALLIAAAEARRQLLLQAHGRVTGRQELANAACNPQKRIAQWGKSSWLESGEVPQIATLLRRAKRSHRNVAYCLHYILLQVKGNANTRELNTGLKQTFWGNYAHIIFN